MQLLSAACVAKVDLCAHVVLPRGAEIHLCSTIPMAVQKTLMCWHNWAQTVIMQCGMRHSPALGLQPKTTEHVPDAYQQLDLLHSYLGQLQSIRCCKYLSIA